MIGKIGRKKLVQGGGEEGIAERALADALSRKGPGNTITVLRGFGRVGRCKTTDTCWCLEGKRGHSLGGKIGGRYLKMVGTSSCVFAGSILK